MTLFTPNNDKSMLDKVAEKAAKAIEEKATLDDIQLAILAMGKKIDALYQLQSEQYLNQNQNQDYTLPFTTFNSIDQTSGLTTQLYAQYGNLPSSARIRIERIRFVTAYETLRVYISAFEVWGIFEPFQLYTYDFVVPLEVAPVVGGFSVYHNPQMANNNSWSLFLFTKGYIINTQERNR